MHFKQSEITLCSDRTLGAQKQCGDFASTDVMSQPISDNSKTIVLIEKRRLIGECLARLISTELGYRVKLFSDLETLQNTGSDLGIALIIVSFEDGSDPRFECAQLEQLGAMARGAPFVVLSDSAEVEDFCRNLSCGARGHVPRTVSLEVGLEALRFVLAGGVFVPADRFLDNARAMVSDACSYGKNGVFTPRQSDVVNALRRGKPNKLIAHDLKMSESTVKVHIRNIMKILGARNRTEVALKVGELSTDRAALG